MTERRYVGQRVRESNSRYCFGDDRGTRHEWGQYMVYGPLPRTDPYVNDRTMVLHPDGFFCIHCTVREPEGET